MKRIVLPLLVLMCVVAPALAQSQSWSYQGRESSQRATSAALTALNKGNVDAAITSLIQATGSDPQDPLPFAILGMALNMKGRYNEASDALHKSYKLDDKVSETVLSLGFTNYLLHDYDKALNAWRKVHKMNPELCHIYADTGYAYVRKGDFKKAEDNFRKLIDCHPNSQVAYQGLAELNYLTGNFKTAAEAAEHAQSIRPYPPVVLLLAKLDLLQGNQSRTQKRIQEYLTATKKPWVQRPMTAVGYVSQHDFHWDPFLVDSFDSGNMLAARALNLPKEASRLKSLARSGKFTQIIDRARAAATAAPDDYYVQRQLGLALLANGQYSDAVESFKKVLTLCPGCQVDYLHLGRALALDGKTAEGSGAVRDFQKRLPKETISPALVEIARVDPGVVPILETKSPATEEKPAADDGF